MPQRYWSSFRVAVIVGGLVLAMVGTYATQKGKELKALESSGGPGGVIMFFGYVFIVLAVLLELRFWFAPARNLR